MQKPIYYLWNRKTKSVYITHSTEEFSKWFIDTENRIVGKDRIGGYEISTVALGLAHNIICDGPPKIFETMIFCNNKDDKLHQYYWRFSTYFKALKGHREACRLIRSYVKQQNFKIVPPPTEPLDT